MAGLAAAFNGLRTIMDLRQLRSLMASREALARRAGDAVCGDALR